MVSTDTGLASYLSTVLQQMSGMIHAVCNKCVLCAAHNTKFAVKTADWLMRGELQKMVLVITSSETREVLERWTFDLLTDKAVVHGG